MEDIVLLPLAQDLTINYGQIQTVIFGKSLSHFLSIMIISLLISRRKDTKKRCNKRIKSKEYPLLSYQAIMKPYIFFLL
jgi:hypothetical protein